MSLACQLDARQSRLTVQAFATGMLSALGHSPTFAVRALSGQLQWSPDAANDTSLKITVQAASLELTDDVSKKDRDAIHRQMFEDVLEISKYPEITFSSTRVAVTKIADNFFRLQIDGTLRLHGVEKQHKVDAQLRIRSEGARLAGEFPLLQSNFNIKPVSALAGTIKLKDELKASFDLFAKPTV